MVSHDGLQTDWAETMSHYTTKGGQLTEDAATTPPPTAAATIPAIR